MRGRSATTLAGRTLSANRVRVATKKFADGYAVQDFASGLRAKAGRQALRDAMRPRDRRALST